MTDDPQPSPKNLSPSSPTLKIFEKPFAKHFSMYNQPAFDAIPDGICVIGKNHLLLDFNKSFYRTFKKSTGVDLQLKVSLLSQTPLKHDMLHEWQKRFDHALQGNEHTYTDLVELKSQHLFLETVMVPVRNQGTINELMLIFRNRSRNKKSQKKISANYDQTRAEYELDRLVYSISHDLRGPVLSIRGLVNLARRESKHQGIDAYLTMMEKSLDKLDHYARQITDYSRDADAPHFDLIDFKSIINGAMVKHQELLSRYPVHITTNIPENLSFWSDPMRLQIIFNNLMANAIEFSNKKADAFLKIDIVEANKKIWLIFSDNGIGVQEEYSSRVFEMFYKASELSTGPGLGLFIVKKAVETLGGSISLSSKVGHGTIVKILLPNVTT